MYRVSRILCLFGGGGGGEKDNLEACNRGGVTFSEIDSDAVLDRKLLIDNKAEQKRTEF